MQEPFLLLNIARDIKRRLSEDRSATLAIVLMAATLAIVYFIVSLARLRQFSALSCPEDCVFGADPWDIIDGGWNIEKHALTFIVLRSLIKAAVFFGQDAKQAFVVIQAMVSSIFAVASFILFVRLRGAVVLAAAMTMWLLSANAIFLYISITETYAFTLAVMALALLFFLELERYLSKQPLAAALWAGLAGGAVALSNLPASAVTIAFSMALWLRRDGDLAFGKRIILGAVPCVVAIAIGLLPEVLLAIRRGHVPLVWYGQYATSWASTSNFFNSEALRNFISVAFVFNWVSVSDVPLCRLIATDLSLLLERPLALFSLGGQIVLAITGIARLSYGDQKRALVLGLLPAIGLLQLFYIYFNPKEAMLYAGQWTFLMIVASGFGLSRARPWPLVIILVAGISFWINDPARWPQSLTLDQCCPTDRR